ncbi:MAG: amidohydrolase family protein, partial [Terriglobia bacterium]
MSPAGLKDRKEPRAWRLAGARIATGAVAAAMMDIEIADATIKHIQPGARQSRSTAEVQTVDLTGYMILPGLINAHDHLEFSLFPRLGHGPYRNFLEWAADIYHPQCSPVKEQLSVPKPVRLWWGAVRNLLCGATTVCHHNPPIPRRVRTRLPVRIATRYAWSHSLALGGDVAKAFQSARGGAPFIIHAAEGVDEGSHAEIFELDRIKALAPKTVIVHGVGMDAAGHDLLE